MKFHHILKKSTLFMTIVTPMVLVSSCKKFLEIPLPSEAIAAEGAYLTDNSTSSVVSGILGVMANNSVFSGSSSIAFRSSMYTDELTNLVGTNVANVAFYSNNIQSSNVNQWSLMYKELYHINLAIEGIREAQPKLLNANQWLGEALFCRAFLYFHLTNLFGDVPVTTSSDYRINDKLGRSPRALAYQQIVSDLKEAQSLLTTDFRDGYSAISTNRGRPNRSAASALLARVYLYMGDWANADTEATKVISRSADFQLVPPAQAFLANSRETIWALVPPTSQPSVQDYGLYTNGMPASLATFTQMVGYSAVSLSPSTLNLFDRTRDLRFANWIRKTTIVTPTSDYYFANKYKSTVSQTEFLIALRLAEVYLIRAEARAKGTDLPGAKADLDAVRLRAGLTDPTTLTSQTDILAAIADERRRELFTEGGHRFYDLKRTGTIDAVMTVQSPLKGGTWASYKQFWPIPPTDITVNPALTQTPGYN